MKKKLLLVLLSLIVAFALAFGLTACDNVERGADGHKHTADIYEVDDTSHWKICETCGEKFSEAEHSFGSDNVCKDCKYSPVFTEGLIYSKIKDDKGKITAYEVSDIGEATGTDIIIPAYHNGQPVTKIGNYAFRDCGWLTSVKLEYGQSTKTLEAAIQ